MRCSEKDHSGTRRSLQTRILTLSLHKLLALACGGTDMAQQSSHSSRPFETNPLECRADFQQAVRDLFDPLRAHWSDGRARILPARSRSSYAERGAALEGFARPLWGVSTLAAGGGSFDHWPAYRRGLRHGTDPTHEEYWGEMTDYSQKAVEASVIGAALAFAPEQLWDPLDTESKHRVATWITQINDVEIPDNNWEFFRVLANVGLDAVGAQSSSSAIETGLERIEAHYEGAGWYDETEYYTPWVYHLYGLLYARFADDTTGRAGVFRQRAGEFASQFAEWFTTSGAGIPYGRSLTYRFAQSAFWGALAVGGVEPDQMGRSWAEVRGLWQRNLQWWATQPILSDGGVLTVGYAYPSLRVMDSYNGPGAPYWGMSTFLPLALEKSHPFWRADPAPHPSNPTQPSVQSAPGPKMTICGEQNGEHVVALTAGTGYPDEKYRKFAYSTAAGFHVTAGAGSIETRSPDNTLLLSDDGQDVRHRRDTEASRVEDGVPYSRYSPWDDVTVETWLVPTAPGHARIHRLDTDRALQTVEGGFPLGVTQDDDPAAFDRDASDSTATARYPTGCTQIDAGDGRTAEFTRPEPNTNLLHPRTIVPALHGEFDAGTHWLTASVFCSTEKTGAPPTVAFDTDDHSVSVRTESGVFRTEQ